MDSSQVKPETKIGSLSQQHLRNRLFAAMAVLMIPLAVASAASVFFHKSAAVGSHYVLAFGQLLEGVAQIKGDLAQVESGRKDVLEDTERDYAKTLGLFSALRAADPDGDEVMEESTAETRQELTDRTIEAGINPIALSQQLGLYGHDMPEDLVDLWEEENEWQTEVADDLSLESAVAAILLATAEIIVDEKTDHASFTKFWAAYDNLPADQIAHVSAVLREKSMLAGRAPVYLSALVLIIAIFAAVFAWVFVALPLIKEIVRMTKELRQEARAARASDMAKTQFLATISHELRTPMNGVIGAAQLLEMIDLPDEDKELIEILNSCADNQMALIEEILTFGEIEAGALRIKPEPMDVTQFMKNATSFATVLAKKKDLSFELSLPEDETIILGDEKRMRQIVVNLVGNAVKFTEQGSVKVKASIVPSENPNEGVFRVAVTDTGPGIEPDMQTRIFDRFTQGDSASNRKAGGTGLGLSIARGIAMEAKGDITLESSVGFGSTFTFEMPTEIITPSTSTTEKKVPAE
ncbi:sensor histidine kinase [Shimia sp. MMG029]|uniref:sensor histidine kinase n=1 Tax=Shimia sp. MMG029 TaxID=3021978 RepID=UPI0022FDD1CF|nr:ATP-binding protein [Shimia sp. MMG029]MDA5555820.1 ATP-binding protein [Shimia sp. MMG029]